MSERYSFQLGNPFNHNQDPNPEAFGTTSWTEPFKTIYFNEKPKEVFQKIYEPSFNRPNIKLGALDIGAWDRRTSPAPDSLIFSSPW